MQQVLPPVPTRNATVDGLVAHGRFVRGRMRSLLLSFVVPGLVLVLIGQFPVDAVRRQRSSIGALAPHSSAAVGNGRTLTAKLDAASGAATSPRLHKQGTPSGDKTNPKARRPPPWSQ